MENGVYASFTSLTATVLTPSSEWIVDNIFMSQE